MQFKLNKNVQKIGQTQSKYFKMYEYLPLIASIVIAVLFFIFAIVDPVVFKFGKYYGIFLLPSGFLCWLIWILIGAFLSVITYFALKVYCSYKILQIMLLKSLVKVTTKIDNKLEKLNDITTEKLQDKTE